MGENGKNAAYDNIKVVVRSRPLNAVEKAANTPVLVNCDQDHGQVAVTMNIGSKRTSKKFNYDLVFGQYSTQADVYKQAVKPVVDEVLQGYNCTVFAYGQTGTGKTHTMEGNIDDPELRGMIPRAVSTIFEALEGFQDAEYTVKVSFLELYNEELQDLLSVTDEVKLRILDDKSRMGTGVACHNLEEVMVKTPEDILNYMKKAMAKRQTGETKLNKSSSRSHCIFTMTVHIREVTPEGEDVLKVGKLNLVDLAGSECIGRSGATNQRAREAGNINKSLLTLGRVISALVEKTPHIPYRDSKLTRLLQESLGGRAKTCIIATVAPSVQCLDETLSTLEYASRAKNIKNKPEANQRMTKRALMKEYAEDIDRLRQELASARAKDGVYLDESRYNELIAGQESQKNQIEELEDLLELKQKEMGELEEKLEDTTSKLEDTEYELESTKVKLDKTSAKLADTKVDLKAQKLLVKETKMLVAAHQETEEKLQQGVSNLQATIEEAKGDVNGLHNVVERKQVIEQKNDAATKAYRASTVESLGSVMQSSSQFYQAQINHHATLEASLQEMSSLHAEQSKSIKEAIKTLSEGAKSNIQELATKDIVEMKDKAKAQWENASETSVAQELATRAAVSSTQDETRRTLVDLLENVLAEHSAKLEKHTEAIRSKLNAVRENVMTHAKAHADAMEAISTKIAADAETNRRKLEEQNKTIKTFAETEHARIESQTSNLVEKMTELLGSFASTSQSNLISLRDQAKASCDTTIQEQIRSEMEAKKLVQDAVDATSSWTSEIAKEHQDLDATVQNDFNELSGQCSKVSGIVESTKSTIEKRLESLSDLATANKTQSVTFYKQAVDQISNQAESIVSKAQTICSEVDQHEQATQIQIQSQEEASKIWTSKQSSISHSQREKIQEFGKNQTSNLKSLEVNCNVFVDEEIKHDKPTGTTPCKKSYAYETTIPATADHEELLESFRQSPDAATDSESESEDSESGADQQLDEETRSLGGVEIECDSQVVEENKHDEEEVQVSNENSDASNTKSLHERENNVAEIASGKPRQLLTKDDILKMKVTELRKELSARGESQVGIKDILQQRLVASLGVE